MRDFQINRDINIPVLVTKEKHSGKCSIYIPDFKITVFGEDYVDAIANAILKASAIYYYNLDRNVRFELKATYADVEKLCNCRTQFATFINLTT